MGQVMNSVGVEEEIAATGLKNMMLAMTKGDAATKSQSKAFAALGLDATKVAVAMQNDAGGAITDLLGRINKLPKATQAATLTQLFGSESVGAIAPLLTNLDKLQKNFALVGDKSQYAGSMEKEFLARIATTEGATGLAVNSLKAVNITLGTMLLPTVTATSQKIVTIANSVRAWAKEHPELAQGLLAAATGIAAFVIGMGALKMGLGLVLGPFGTVFSLIATNGPKLVQMFGVMRMAAMFLARGVMQAGMMMLANPIVLAITTVVAVLGIAAYMIYKHWTAIKGYFTRNWTTIRNLLLGAMVIFTPLIAAIVFVGALIYRNWDKITAVTSAMIGRIVANFDLVKGAVISMVSGVARIVAPFMAPFLRIRNFLSGLISQFFQFGVNIVQGLIRGIASMAGAVTQSLINLVGNIGGKFAALLGIKSPSRVFMAYGGFITEGLARGIDRGKGQAIGAAAAMATGVAGAGLATMSPAMAANGMAGSNVTQHVTITIHAAPGQSPADIAEAVKQALEQKSNSSAATRRSAFSDV